MWLDKIESRGQSFFKYFYYRYRPPGSSRILDEPIGNASTLSLAHARNAVTIKAGEVAKGIDLRERRRSAREQETTDEIDSHLQLFNYIDHYYEPYAKEHSVTADEIVKTLKREFESLKDKPIYQIDSHDIEQWRTSRSGDIFDLHWEHIDFANNQIRKILNKTSHKAENPQPVVVPMSPTVKNTLEQWGRQHGMSGRVFKSPKTGGRLDNISKAWRSILKQAELGDFRFKDLRHTFGSWLAIDGVNILQIRDLMGHTDVKTTQIYAHLCPAKKEQSIMDVFS